MPNQLQPNLTRSLWDTLLFAQPLEFAVNMPLEDCLDALSNLALPQTGFLNPTRRTVEVQKMDNDTFKFEICIKRYSRGFMDFTNAKCAGVLFKEHGSARLVVEGKITAGIFLLPLYTSLVAISLASLSSPGFGLIAAGIVIGSIYGLQSWTDRHKLRALIYEALQHN